MARVALVGAARGTETAIRAAAPEHDLVAWNPGESPAPAADLFVVDEDRDAAAALATVRSATRPTAPVLLLVGPRATPAGPLASAGTATVAKPADIFQLRLTIRALLAAFAKETGDEALPFPVREPFLDPVAARAVAAALRLGSPVLLCGEAGTGRRHLAAALAQAWSPGGQLTRWNAAVATADGPSAVALVPALEELGPGEQEELASLLAAPKGPALIALAGDDVVPLVASGRLDRSLYYALSRLLVRIAPLRLRTPAETATLAREVAERIAARLLRRAGTDAASGAATTGAGALLTDAAVELLIAYQWPGNFLEFEGVIARSLAAKAATAELRPVDAEDLLFDPTTWPLPAKARRAVVLPMSPPGAGSEEVATAPGEVGHASPGEIEALLAGFAHDVRNPLATVKAFASLAASEASGDGELAAFAAEACVRIDEHLALLQRYSELEAQPAESFDVIEEIAAAAADLAPALSLDVLARRPLVSLADRAAARLVAEAVLEECRERLRAGARVAIDVDRSGRTLEMRVPIGAAAVENLGRWLDGEPLPWRLALARDAARRGAGTLDFDSDGEELRLRWRLPSAEEADDDRQALRIDRRRRSRSS